MELGVDQIAVPAIVGAIMTIVIPVVIRQSWPKWARLAVAVVMTLAVAAAVVIAWLRPATWEQVAAGLAVAVTVGQTVYNFVKQTGLFTWIGEAVHPTAKYGIEDE